MGFYYLGYFWEKLELENFPLDIQELSIVLTSKLKYTQMEFKTDPDKPSSINYKASKIFVDQQKWYLYKFVKVSDYASYDLPSNGNNININLNETSAIAVSHLVQQHELEQLDSEPTTASRLLKNGRRSARYAQAKFVASCYCARRAG